LIPLLVLAILAGSFSLPNALADEVVLKDGSRIVGQVLRL
jgi:hypothetical protein